MKDINLLPKEYENKIKYRKLIRQFVITAFVMIFFIGITNILIKVRIDLNNKSINLVNDEIINKKFSESEKIVTEIDLIETNITLLSNANNNIIQNDYLISELIDTIFYISNDNILFSKITYSSDNKNIILDCVTNNNESISDFMTEIKRYDIFQDVTLTDFYIKEKIYFSVSITFGEYEDEQVDQYE